MPTIFFRNVTGSREEFCDKISFGFTLGGPIKRQKLMFFTPIKPLVREMVSIRIVQAAWCYLYLPTIALLPG